MSPKISIAQALGLLRSLVIYYQPRRTRAWKKFYRHLIEEGQIAFDVGAHVGSRSRVLRSLGAKVVAIEPQRHFASFLARTLPKDIALIQAAVGPRSEQAVLKASSKHPTVSSLNTDFVEQAANAPGFKNVAWDKSEIVSVFTLDDIIKQHGMPQYLKIDVEGFELEVLKGLSKPISIISFEYLPGFKELSQDVISRLMTLGDYSFNVVIGERAEFAWSEWQDHDQARGWLENLEAGTKSGDIFAKLNASN